VVVGGPLGRVGREGGDGGAVGGGGVGRGAVVSVDELNLA